ncbi:reductase [Litorihabitans aurantiacus]|uniref:Reductase n=1 Tax=Litorihabitans aurantiacus TaxID=1930061 RepID=A0AA37UNE3_9MICO|nr:reductase [Litorihabitans aurantiacus]GMA30116.1 reductase [Litorihabitans aurantiacus]
MRRVLVLGGTAWLGRAIVRQLVAGGDDVVCLARGESGEVPDGARLVAADRRSPGAYDDVRGDWDEVVELAYEPDLVGPAVEALAERAAHWTLVSSVSVYRGHGTVGADESADVVEPADLAAYPDAKVAAERVTARHLDGRLLVARPGLIVGPGDPSDRFGYWSARLARGGDVLVPRMSGRHVQVIDVSDLAAWLADAGRTGLAGVVDAVGHADPMADLLRVVSEATGHRGALVEADDEALLAHDVRYWAGPRSLPLWLPLADAGFARRSGARFRASGGRLRPLGETVRRTLADEVARGIDRDRRSGLTPAQEAEVLSALG